MADDNIIDLKPDKSGRKWSPDRKAAWKERMAKTNDKPASGMPAMGEGWGGSKRGDHAIAGPSALIPGQGAEKRERTRARDRSRDELAADMLDKIVAVVEDPDTPAGLVIMGADKVLDRVEGRPATKIALTGGEDGDKPIDQKITIHFVDAKP